MRFQTILTFLLAVVVSLVSATAGATTSLGAPSTLSAIASGDKSITFRTFSSHNDVFLASAPTLTPASFNYTPARFDINTFTKRQYVGQIAFLLPAAAGIAAGWPTPIHGHFCSLSHFTDSCHNVNFQPCERMGTNLDFGSIELDPEIWRVAWT